jgi:hypothetical protein
MQDNLYPNEIDSIVYETMSSSDGMQNEMRESILAEKVLAAALDRSFDTGAVCPFVDEARAEVRWNRQLVRRTAQPWTPSRGVVVVVEMHYQHARILPLFPNRVCLHCVLAAGLRGRNWRKAR